MLVVCPPSGHARAEARRLGPRRRSALAWLATALVLVLALGLALARSASAGRPRANVRAASGARAGAELAGTRDKSALVWLAPDLASYPARGGGAVVVYLHGVHGKPENGCPWMRAGSGALLCPRADVRHADGTASWSGSPERTAAVVANALRTAGAADDAPVLVGFSQGAYEIDALVRARKARARGIVLLAGHLVPDAAALRDAGVTRVVLGAATNDATYPALTREAARLARDGFAVRLVPLGDVGHVYIANNPEVLRDAIGWAAGADGRAAEGRAGARACRTAPGGTSAGGGARA